MNITKLRARCASADSNERKAALASMRGADPALAVDIIQLAREQVEDDDNDCRWQALVVIGEYVESHPDEVWEIVCQYGRWQDCDMRDAVATVLLEHLLEFHFESTCANLEREIHSCEDLLGDTLARCWPFGAAEPQWHRVDALLKRWE